MPVRFTIDSNVLVYATDGRDTVRRESAIELIARAMHSDCAILLPQALAEFFHVVTRKGIVPRAEAAQQVRRWMSIFVMSAGADAGAVAAAAEATGAGRFQFYDALLLTTARSAGCAAVISEDMADGAELDGVRVVAVFDDTGQIAAGAQALLNQPG